MGFTLRYTLKINMSMHCIRYLQEKLNHLSTRLWLNSPLKYRTGVTAPIRLFLICCYKYIYCIRQYINRYRVHCSTICHFTGDILLQITINIEMSFRRLSQHHTESKKENLSNQQKNKERSVLRTVKQTQLQKINWSHQNNRQGNSLYNIEACWLFKYAYFITQH